MTDASPGGDPIARFLALLEEAERVPREILPEPTAFALATVDERGAPRARIVLLKNVDERGFVFYTNHESRKGRELLATRRAALCFHWPPLEVQVRVEGTAERRAPRRPTRTSRRVRAAARSARGRRCRAERSSTRATSRRASPRWRNDSRADPCPARRTGPDSASLRAVSSSGKDGRTACTFATCTSGTVTDGASVVSIRDEFDYFRRMATTTRVTDAPAGSAAPANGAAAASPPGDATSGGWSIDAARALYNIEGWGAGFFDVNDEGHVIVRPDQDQPDRIARPVRARERPRGAGGRPPGAAALLRHPPVAHRGRSASGSQQAREEFDYNGGYTTVYPIKVNQQRHVVEEIVQFGESDTASASSAGASPSCRRCSASPRTPST